MEVSFQMLTHWWQILNPKMGKHSHNKPLKGKGQETSVIITLNHFFLGEHLSIRLKSVASEALDDRRPHSFLRLPPVDSTTWIWSATSALLPSLFLACPSLNKERVIQIYQKSQRIGWVIPRWNLRCGFSQPIFWFFVHIFTCAVRACCRTKIYVYRLSLC